MLSEGLWIDTTLDYTFKGTVQRKLTGVISYISWEVLHSHWTADILF
jgi:hypothetical protein